MKTLREDFITLCTCFLIFLVPFLVMVFAIRSGASDGTMLIIMLFISYPLVGGFVSTVGFSIDVILQLRTDKEFLCSICGTETNYNKKLKICYNCEKEIKKMIGKG